MLIDSSFDPGPLLGGTDDLEAKLVPLWVAIC